jgi:hypothetical protein
MSEELIVPGEQQSSTMAVQAEDKQTTTTPDVDPYESEAREQGWKPKEEYEGDPEKWRPAKEFVERGELFGKIDVLGRELKETKKALKMLQEHNLKIKETEYKRAVDELKALQKKHLEEGNSDGYLETTELLTDLKAEQKAREAVSQVQPQQVDPRFNAWVETNKWYAQDAELREYADVVGMGYAQKNPGLDPEDVLKFVAAQVKLRYPNKFQNPNRNKPSAVEGASTTSSPKTNSFELTDDERKVMNTFIRTGAMTKEEFIAQVKMMRGTK